MAGYRDSSAYDFSLFEEPAIPERAAKTVPQNNTRGSAPKKQSAPQKRASAQPKTHGNAAVKTAARAYAMVDSYGKTVERNSSVALVSPTVKRVLLFGVVCFALMSCLLFMRAQSDKITAGIEDVKADVWETRATAAVKTARAKRTERGSFEIAGFRQAPEKFPLD